MLAAAMLDGVGRWWPGRPGWARWGLLLLAVGLAAHVVSIALRPGGDVSVFWDGWYFTGLEAAAALLVLARAVRGGRQDRPWLLLGSGMAVYAAADVVYTAAYLAPGRQTPFPSLAEPGWLAFYPFAYAALLLRLRAQTARIHRSMWLDGLVAALGAAAVGVIAVEVIARTATGGTVEVVTLVAYPAGDLVLLMVLLGVLGLRGWRLGDGWGWLAAGMTLFAGADTGYLLGNAADTYVDGSPIDSVWLAAFLAFAAAAWARPTHEHLPARGGLRLLAVPAAVALLALVMLLAGALGAPVPVAAALLAAAALTAVVARAALTYREVSAFAEARRQAVTDDLTGLANRRLLYARLEEILARPAHARRLALLLCDLDRFKEINDALGHQAGDDLLCQLADRWAQTLGGEALLTRLGGDEFAVLADGADQLRAEQLAARLSAALAQPLVVQEVSLHIDASIGIALSPDHAASRGPLLRCADVAMYAAKRSRGGPAVYQPGADLHSKARLLTLEQLRGALETGQLICYYQPKAELPSGRIVGAEALVRWVHPDRGLLTPDQFLPLAEHAGLMRYLTRIALDRALTACAQWRRADHDVTVAVNLSVSNLLDTALPAEVAAGLSRHRLPAAALELEITESVLMADPDRAADTVTRLRDLGVAVSIDDYGTGYSSLAYLRRLAVTELKLDRSFVAGLGEDPRDAAIIRSTVQLAHSLGLRMVAEGVETADDWHHLARLGVDFAQGYYVSRPLPEDQLHELLTRIQPKPARQPHRSRPDRG